MENTTQSNKPEELVLSVSTEAIVSTNDACFDVEAGLASLESDGSTQETKELEQIRTMYEQARDLRYESSLLKRILPNILDIQ
jgi:hypothetical protein